MGYYLFNSALCLGLLLVFYRLLLESQSTHTFKRYYLLLTPIAALLIPLIKVQEVVISNGFTPVPLTAISPPFMVPEHVLLPDSPGFNIELFLIGGYVFGGLLFFIRFSRNLYYIVRKIRRNERLRGQRYIYVLLDGQTTPHTFFHYIFVGKEQFERQHIPEEVLVHEQAHALQKHSLDILLTEVLHFVFWFNPLFIWLKRSIRLNHEFLADHYVLNLGYHRSRYQTLLLDQSLHGNPLHLTNAFNYVFIKKRFILMKTHSSLRAIWLRNVLLIPFMGLILMGFGHREFVTPQFNDLTTANTLQEGATQEQIDAYNALASKYNTMPSEGMRIIGSEVTRLEHLYGLMTPEQREQAEPYPNFPVPPTPPEPPTADTVLDIVEVPPPPPPTPPLSPIEHLREMAQKNATFYFEEKSITADEAIKLLKQNGNLNLVTQHTSDTDYIVKISKHPYVHPPKE